MRRNVCGIFSILLIFMISCSWSPEQKDILNAFNETVQSINEHRWESASSLISTSTIDFLDSLSADLSARGLPEYETGTDILPVLCEDYIDFSGDITMIFIQGEKAEITLSSSVSYKYPMIREGGQWRLDLTQKFRDRLDIALTGSYVQ